MKINTVRNEDVTWRYKIRDENGRKIKNQVQSLMEQLEMMVTKRIMKKVYINDVNC